MKKLNLIVVFNKTLNKVLFCIRTKEPFKGLYNFVGGKVEKDESNDDAAYRELYLKKQEYQTEEKQLLIEMEIFQRDNLY